MIELVLGLTVLAGLALMLPAVVRRRRVPTQESQQLWAVAQANTTDGVTARLGVEFVALLDADVDPSTVIDTVEDLLRQEISSSAAHQLPSVGDVPPGLGGATLVGTSIEHAVVSSSEIEVTPEFRRLIGAPD